MAEPRHKPPVEQQQRHIAEYRRSARSSVTAITAIVGWGAGEIEGISRYSLWLWPLRRGGAAAKRRESPKQKTRVKHAYDMPLVCINRVLEFNVH